MSHCAAVLLTLVLASGPDPDGDIELLIRAAEAALSDSDPHNDCEAVNKVLRAVQKIGTKVELDVKKSCLVMTLKVNGKDRCVEERIRDEKDGFEATLRCARRLIAE